MLREARAETPRGESRVSALEMGRKWFEMTSGKLGNAIDCAITALIAANSEN
jgi:alpha-mannosidase